MACCTMLQAVKKKMGRHGVVRNKGELRSKIIERFKEEIYMNVRVIRGSNSRHDTWRQLFPEIVSGDLVLSVKANFTKHKFSSTATAPNA